MNYKLRDRQILRLKAKEHAYDMRDGDGHVLRIYPTGRKVFQFVPRINGKQKRITIGEYPSVYTLEESREKHKELYREYKRGGSIEKLYAIAGTKTGTMFTVSDMVDLFVSDRTRKVRSDNWHSEMERLLKNEVVPNIGHMRPDDITIDHINECLKRLLSGGKNTSYNHLLSVISSLFKYGRDTSKTRNDPSAGISKLQTEERERNLSADEIKVAWSALSTPNPHDRGNHDKLTRALRLILVTGQRPTECLHITHDEIDAEWWTIPKERTKTGREQRIYLAETARTLIGDGESGLVFQRRDGKPLATSTLSRLVRSLLGLQGTLKHTVDMAPWTPHDLRRTCATMIGNIGYDEEIIDKRILNHTPKKVSRIYIKSRYDDIKKEMMLAWEKKLKEILE